MSIRPRPLSAALRQLLGGTALLLCAQTVQADDQSTAPAPQDQADPNQAKLLGNITVTAQSRNQEMQSVPIPLQIITAKQVDTLAATDLSKMDMFVPGLVVSADQPTQPRYQLRGIATSDFGIGTEPAVGVYINGVYAARSGGALLAFNDLARVEVLKGRRARCSAATRRPARSRSSPTSRPTASKARRACASATTARSTAMRC